MRLRAILSNASASGTGANEGEATSQNDRATHSAISALVGSSEQTYDQFLQGFMHLTAADVAPAVMQRAFGSGDDIPLFLRQEKPPRPPSPVLAPPKPSENSQADDELEEEILDVDAHTHKAGSVRPQRALQLDNFIEDESEEDLSEVGSGYLASFAGGDNVMIDKCRPLTRVDTTTPAPKEEEPKMLSQMELRTSSVMSDEVQTHTQLSESESESSELVYNTDLDLPNPGEVEDMPPDSPYERATSAAMVTNIRHMSYSARPAESAEPLSTYEHTNIETFVSEVSDLGENKDSAKRNEDLESDPSQQVIEEEAAESVQFDQVEPFSLDTDFDYDNVVLTPKFTAAEQKYLEELATRGRLEKEAAEAARKAQGELDELEESIPF